MRKATLCGHYTTNNDPLPVGIDMVMECGICKRRNKQRFNADFNDTPSIRFLTQQSALTKFRLYCDCGKCDGCPGDKPYTF